ncbi:HisA/HisF-related TIM barrel protein [Planctomicrobium sp. SH668]|uniref:HisA/HisF-related TIM barrel protein n=1 Tax=Planctomicrobium sp. SH668 TaxID=3448126 RepID=UPI003F5BFB67
MELVPVVDLMQGVVVRGHAGQREKYLPNKSRLLESSDPLQTALALSQNYQARQLYVADLDGIQFDQPQYAILAQIVEAGLSISVDSGIRTILQAEQLLKMGVKKVIVSLESLPDLELMREFVSSLGAEQILFSLDLKNGEPFGAAAGNKNPIEIVWTAVDCGVRQMIILDVAKVGSHSGVATGALCHTIKKRWPDLVLWTGGGVRSLADLQKLSLDRVDGAMVSSALHDGLITPQDWKGYLDLDQEVIQLAMDA